MHLEARRSEPASLVVNMQNLVFWMKVRRSSTFSFKDAGSIFFCLYGSAGRSPVWALEKVDMVMVTLYQNVESVVRQRNGEFERDQRVVAG
jgi:hypothetical protein